MWIPTSGRRTTDGVRHKIVAGACLDAELRQDSSCSRTGIVVVVIKFKIPFNVVVVLENCT